MHLKVELVLPAITILRAVTVHLVVVAARITLQWVLKHFFATGQGCTMSQLEVMLVYISILMLAR